MSKSQPPEIPFKAPSNATEWLIAVAILPLCIALTYFLGEARGWMVGVSTGALAFFILFAWPLRRQAWFWAVFLMFVAIHAAGATEFSWSWVVTQRSGIKGLGTLATIDLLIMCGVTYAIYRLKYGVPAKSIEPSIDDLPRYTDRDLGF